MLKQRKTRNRDCYEIVAENIRLLDMNENDAERKVNKIYLNNLAFLNTIYFKNIKKQRTDEQIVTPLFNSNNITDCIDVR